MGPDQGQVPLKYLLDLQDTYILKKESMVGCSNMAATLHDMIGIMVQLGSFTKLRFFVDTRCQKYAVYVLVVGLLPSIKKDFIEG